MTYIKLLLLPPPHTESYVGETTSLLRAISKIALNHREIFCALGPKKLYIMIAVFH